jgi:hypothetical protein
VRLLLPLFALLSGCWGECGFSDNGCEPPPPPDPCGERRRIVAGGQVVAADDGGAFSISFEGRYGIDLVARRFDANGALSWSVPLDYIGVGIHPFALGDTFVLVLDDTRILGLRDGAVAFTTNAPEAPATLRCLLGSAVREQDELHVVGSVHGVDAIGNGVVVHGDTLVGCSYHVGRDGSVSDALLFGSARYTDGIMPGRLPAIALSTGGYAVGTQDALLRYDAAGQPVWQRAVVWPGPIVESSGGLFVLSGAADLELVSADGASDTPLVTWSAEKDIRVLALLAVPRGVVAALQWADGNALALVDAHGLVWQQPLGNIRKTSAGAMHVVVDGDALSAYDLDGNVRWTRVPALDAFAAADASTRLLDRITVDDCVQAATVSSVDAGGVTQWSWTAP